MANWREMLKEEFEENGDNFDKMVCTLSESEQIEEFSWSEGGKPFTAWGEKFVYSPVCYDGDKWVGSAPRFPCDIATDHQGG